MSDLLKHLIRLFPPAFQQQFRVEMADQIDHDYQSARDKGLVSTLNFSFSTVLDLLRSSIAEHWSPSWKPPTPHSSRTKDKTTMLENWTQDFHQATRSLRKSPGFSLAIIATLGIAIGLNTGIFSVVDTVLLDPLPFRDSDRLVRIAASAPGSDLPSEFGVGREFYAHYAEHSKLLDGAALYNSFTSSFRFPDRTERLRMSFPTRSLFTTLGVIPILGRLPVEDDKDDVMLLSHSLWKTWLAADPDILDRTFFVNGKDRTVIGVMGSDFWFPNDTTLLWIPQETVNPSDITPGRFGAPLVARLVPGATEKDLVNELRHLALELPDRFGGSAEYAAVIERHQPVVRSLGQELLGPASQPLWLLMGAVGLVLLIACANVANLFMVRAERRRQDLAIQRAMGASRFQVIRTLMAETLLLACFAGLLAIGLAWSAGPLLIRAAPDIVPRLDRVSITATTLLFTVLATLATAFLCGLLPAIKASSVDLSSLHESGRGNTRRRHWVRNGLVIAQTALALLLLIGSGLLLRSFDELRNVDPGYVTKDRFTFQIAPEGNQLTDSASYARFHTDFAERVAALPGVQSVGIIENVPLNEGLRQARFRTDASGSDEHSGPRLGFTWASGNYFSTMGIRLLQGRTFTSAEDLTPQSTVVLSQTAANQLWPGQDPLGRRLQHENLETWQTVIGVVDDVLQYGYRDEPEPVVYLPMVGEGPNAATLYSPAYVVHTKRAERIATEIRALVQQVAPNAPMYRTYTMEGLAADSMAQLSRTALTLAFASIIALLLGAIGLYGVLSYVVAERTREIGVRMALGAAPKRVQLMVVSQGIKIVLVGVAIGLLAAAAGTRLLGSLLYEVAALDIPIFVGTSLAMLFVGLIATFLPARHASTVDPLQSLRGD